MNPAKQNLDVWVYPTNTYRLFFNTDIEDPRTWDLRIIGEMYDMTLSDIVAAFARDKTTCDDIYRIYGDTQRATLIRLDYKGTRTKIWIFICRPVQIFAG